MALCRGAEGLWHGMQCEVVGEGGLFPGVTGPDHGDPALSETSHKVHYVTYQTEVTLVLPWSASQAKTGQLGSDSLLDLVLAPLPFVSDIKLFDEHTACLGQQFGSTYLGRITVR